VSSSFANSEFDWDQGNTAKCQKHGPSIPEIEAFFAGNPLVVEDYRHSIDEKRLIAVGMSRAGGMMFVGFTIRLRDGRQLIRPVTARYMGEKEFLRYVGRTS
jgi:uncharacterized DUF497 family protein